MCAEVAGIFLNADGEPIDTSLSDRLVAISADQMKSIPDVIAIPYGINKQPAVQAALHSGLVNSLVTHTSLATALLSRAHSGG